MALYEHVVIARQDISPQQAEALNDQLKSYKAIYDLKIPNSVAPAVTHYAISPEAVLGLERLATAEGFAAWPNTITATRGLPDVATLFVTLRAGCSSSTTSPANSAELRVINASPGTAPIDVYLQTALAVDSLPYSFANPYVFVQSGTVDIAVRLHGAINVLLETGPSFTVGAFYTFAITGPSGALTDVFLTDDTTSAASSSNFKSHNTFSSSTRRATFSKTI